MLEPLDDLVNGGQGPQLDVGRDLAIGGEGDLPLVRRVLLRIHAYFRDRRVIRTTSRTTIRMAIGHIHT